MEISAQGPRTEPVMFKGQAAWIKRPEPARKSRFVWLHRLLIPLLPVALRPTNSVGGPEGMAIEVARLKQFAKAGLPVPKILQLGTGHIVLPDCGDMLHIHILTMKNPTKRMHLVKQALDVLLAVHHAGLTHGRPYFKDFVIKPETGRITMLDLEEDSSKTMPIADAQARDLWLFLASACDFFAPAAPALSELQQYYCERAPAQTLAALKPLARGLRPYRRFIDAIHARNLAREVTGAYWATLTLETLPDR